ncbi:uncharacterized protein ACRADG_004023 [Cochliomyia hominivorax]
MENIEAKVVEATGLKAAKNYYSCTLQEPVKLRSLKDDERKIKTIPQFFHECCEKYKNIPALAYESVKENSGKSEWFTVTYGEYEKKVEHTALMLLHLGVKPRTSVAILAFNCPEWFYVEMAALRIGAIVAGIYCSNSAEAVHHVLETSDCSVCVVDDAEQMKKVYKIKSRLPHLKAVIQLNGPYEDYVGQESGYYKWQDLFHQEFEKSLKEELMLRESQVAANECAMLIFTSGTTGLPKGAMLSHDSILFCSSALIKLIPSLQQQQQTAITYLPLNHIAAQTFDVFMAIENGFLIYFADRNALKGSLSKTFQKAKPTILVGVPRVYEKMQEKIIKIEANSNKIIRLLMTVARYLMESYHLEKMSERTASAWKYWLASTITNKIKTAMGLDHAKVCFVGGAPLSEETKKFFLSIDLPLVDVFGMSETSGAITFNTDQTNLQTVGKPIPGVEIKIANPDKKGEGEILLKGPCNFIGYLKEPQKTLDAVTEDDWLKSGDLGYLDSQGNLYISGRLKELIITAGGENIPPVHIEELIAKELPCLSNVLVIGDHKKYLTALITFKTDIDSDTGYPLDTLRPEAIEWLATLDVHYTHLSDLLNVKLPENLENFDPNSLLVKCDPKVWQALEEGINRYNQQAISKAQKVQYFSILPHDFSIPTGELVLKNILNFNQVLKEICNKKIIKMMKTIRSQVFKAIRLKFAKNFYSCSLQEPVKLRYTNERIIKTIPQFFHECCEKYKQLPALAYESAKGNNGKSKWCTITYGEYEKRVEQTALMLLHLGVQARSSVAILAFNCPEWFYVEMAALRIRATLAGIYTSNSEEAVYHVLKTSDSSVCVVDDAEQMQKVQKIKTRLPLLKAVIQLNGPYEDYVGQESGYYKWQDLFEKQYDKSFTEELLLRESQVAANDCALIVFTSGTTGLPKGAMLSHDSILFSSQALNKLLPSLQQQQQTAVTYLPLSHMAAQTFDIFMAIENGFLVYFADRNALKGSLVKTYQEAKPTILLGVPRVYEKLQEQIIKLDTNSTKITKIIKTFASNLMESYHMEKISDKSNSEWKYWLASKVTRETKMSLGLDQVKVCFMGGAPLSEETKRYFLSLDLPLTDIYGLSETSGAITYNFDHKNLQIVGKAIQGVEIKIHDPNEKREGEIWLRGPCNFMGYLKETEKTFDTLTMDGWLKTGDLGYLDSQGNLYISGRLKELIITAGGENIPPVHIEDFIKKELPCLNNVVVIGDNKKYLTALMTFKTDVDPQTGHPLDSLRPEAIEWLATLDVHFTHLSDLLDSKLSDNFENFDYKSLSVNCDQKVWQALEDGVKRYNEQALSNAQKVQYFSILPHDFSIPTGELGPTLKMRRNIVHQKYATLIEEIFSALSPLKVCFVGGGHFNMVKQTGLKFAENYYSCSLQEPVKLRHFEDENAERQIKTIPQFFHECCEKYKNLPALAYKLPQDHADKSEWCTITYGEYEKRVEQTALMLLHLGVQARSSVGILAFNCPEWFYVEMATFRIGAVVAGIYTSNSEEAVRHVLDTSDCSVCVVDDAQQMSKVRGCKARLPKLKAIIQLNGPYEDYVGQERGYYKWPELFDLKFDRSLREELLLRESQVAANECAMLLFTTDIDPDTGYPLDTLRPEAIEWLESLGVHYSKLSELLHINLPHKLANFDPNSLSVKCVPKIWRALEAGIKRYNQLAISNAQKVQYFTILPHDFSLPTGELGPTLKIKRSAVHQKYEGLIDKMYRN